MSAEKILSKKLFAQYWQSWKAFSFGNCLMSLFAVFGKVCGPDVGQLHMNYSDMA